MACEAQLLGRRQERVMKWFKRKPKPQPCIGWQPYQPGPCPVCRRLGLLEEFSLDAEYVDPEWQDMRDDDQRGDNA